MIDFKRLKHIKTRHLVSFYLSPDVFVEVVWNHYTQRYATSPCNSLTPCNHLSEQRGEVLYSMHLSGTCWIWTCDPSHIIILQNWAFLKGSEQPSDFDQHVIGQKVLEAWGGGAQKSEKFWSHPALFGLIRTGASARTLFIDSEKKI